MEKHDLVVIGGGPAGLAAALAARQNGIEDILILERDNHLGGILNQCIHNGFGLHFFKEELTGPEYAARFVEKVFEENIPYKTDTMVIDISEDKVITAVNSSDGMLIIQARAVILAMGCRERPRGALNIPGSRCAGVYSAGTAQRYVNLEGLMPGKSVVILGSGDIGLIMARRMTLEGAEVKAVVELMPFSSGLKRNIVQCLNDYDIPLKLSHTVTKILGKERLEGVVIAQVDENRKPILSTEERIPCDTLLLSVGLLPENELSKKAKIKLSSVTGGSIVDESLETSVSGIFACGNVLHVHDLVDHVSEESSLAGKNAASYLKGRLKKEKAVAIAGENGVRYTVPSMLHLEGDGVEDGIAVRFRVDQVYQDHYLSIYCDDTRIKRTKKRILTPGEMETVQLSRAEIKQLDACSRIAIRIERM